MSKVQAARKEAGLEVEDRIVLSLRTESTDLKKAIELHQQMICREVLATGLGPLEGIHKPVKAGDETVEIAVERA